MVDAMQEDGSTPSFVESLIAQFAPPADVFTVELGASKLSFSAVRSYSDIRAMQDRAARYVKYCRSDKAKPYAVPEDDETIVSAFVLSETSVEPKLSQADCLTLAAKAGYIFKALVDQWNAAQIAPRAEAEADEIERLKND